MLWMLVGCAWGGDTVAPAKGQPFAPTQWTTHAGVEATIPDTAGKYVVLELIRSADW